MSGAFELAADDDQGESPQSQLPTLTQGNDQKPDGSDNRSKDWDKFAEPNWFAPLAA